MSRKKDTLIISLSNKIIMMVKMTTMILVMMMMMVMESNDNDVRRYLGIKLTSARAGIIIVTKRSGEGRGGAAGARVKHWLIIQPIL